MDKLLYNYFGYNEDYIKNKSASLIQKTYINYKSYQIQKKMDLIKYYKTLINKKNEKTEKDENEEIKEENDYWNKERIRVKSEKVNLILKDYEIVNLH
tara:strand:+ start:453 stop:746 length:294 start_codon:yes stop_codon:yes gene_type:complete